MYNVPRIANAPEVDKDASAAQQYAESVSGLSMARDSLARGPRRARSETPAARVSRERSKSRSRRVPTRRVSDKCHQVLVGDIILEQVMAVSHQHVNGGGGETKEIVSETC